MEDIRTRRIQCGVTAAVSASLLYYAGGAAGSAPVRNDWSSLDRLGVGATLGVALIALLVALAGALLPRQVSPKPAARAALILFLVALVGWSVGMVESWWYTAS